MLSAANGDRSPIISAASPKAAKIEQPNCPSTILSLKIIQNAAEKPREIQSNWRFTIKF
jgi:hypothetical protein